MAEEVARLGVKRVLLVAGAVMRSAADRIAADLGDLLADRIDEAATCAGGGRPCASAAFDLVLAPA